MIESGTLPQRPEMSGRSPGTTVVSQVLVPLGICAVIQQAGHLTPLNIWLAILTGHVTRCALSVIRFNQGRWRTIAVDIEPRPG